MKNFEKANITIFVSTLGAGGAEKQAALLASILQKRYIVHFVALYGNADKSEYVLDLLNKADVKVYTLSGSTIHKLRLYSKILRDNNVKIAFNYLTQCDFWGAIIERYCGVSQIYNGIRNTNIEIWKTWLEKFSHNYIVTATIFNSFAGKDVFIHKGFKSNKCVTIPNCFPNISRPIVHKQNSILRLITVGRFVEQKDYLTAIQVFSELTKKFNNIVFDICGYGILESKIRKWVYQYGVSKNVIFHIKSNNIPDLLKNADIYISTSLFEGTSNSIMEAMNYSLPIVSTTVGDNNKLVIPLKNGFLHQVGDVYGLASSISKLIDNTDLRLKMGINSNLILKDNYSVDIFEKRYLSLLEG